MHLLLLSAFSVSCLSVSPPACQNISCLAILWSGFTTVTAYRCGWKPLKCLKCPVMPWESLCMCISCIHSHNQYLSILHTKTTTYNLEGSASYKWYTVLSKEKSMVHIWLPSYPIYSLRPNAGVLSNGLKVICIVFTMGKEEGTDSWFQIDQEVGCWVAILCWFSLTNHYHILAISIFTTIITFHVTRVSYMAICM